MKIGIICPHSFPIPYKNRSGDICILDMAKALDQMGHDVHMFAPSGTDWKTVHPIKCTYGAFPPSAQECEEEALATHGALIKEMDIIHDFSSAKRIAELLSDPKRVITTHYGGSFNHPNPPYNVVAVSQAQRLRLLRGDHDYAGIDEKAQGTSIKPVAVKVVYHGINTGFYTPGKDYQKDDFILWVGRWHPVRGYKFAIELAKKTGIKLVMAGEHPDREIWEQQRQWAMEAVRAAAGYDNITFEWLSPDPNHHTHKRELMQRARAVLQPTQFHEPGGLTQIEALSCGTPVIATNYGSMPEVINHGKTGFICNNDLDEFAEAIAKIDEIDPTLCRKNAAQRFDRRVMAKGYLDLYETIRRGETW